MIEPLWVATGAKLGRLELTSPALQPEPPPMAIGLLTMYGRDSESFRIDAEAMLGLRDALDRLLADDENLAAPDPASLYIGRRAVAIGRQLDEHVQALARVTQRAYELDGAMMPVSLKVAKLMELVHLLAVQEQRVAASLGDLLSELAGGQS